MPFGWRGVAVRVDVGVARLVVPRSPLHSPPAIVTPRDRSPDRRRDKTGVKPWGESGHQSHTALDATTDRGRHVAADHSCCRARGRLGCVYRGRFSARRRSATGSQGERHRGDVPSQAGARTDEPSTCPHQEGSRRGDVLRGRARGHLPRTDNPTGAVQHAAVQLSEYALAYGVSARTRARDRRFRRLQGRRVCPVLIPLGPKALGS